MNALIFSLSVFTVFTPRENEISLHSAISGEAFLTGVDHEIDLSPELSFPCGTKYHVRGRTFTKTKVRRMWGKERVYMLAFNLTRILSGHHPLIQGLRLNKAAFEHSKNMALNKYGIGHHFFSRRSDQYNFDAENVAYNYRSIFGALFGWITSDGHRENMYSYSHLFSGVGFCKVKKITYKYNKKGKAKRIEKEKFYYYTQVFR